MIILTLISIYLDIKSLTFNLLLKISYLCYKIQNKIIVTQEYTEHERRQFLIARLPNVQTLNGGGLISTEEREDSERAFIRYYMDKPEVDRPERFVNIILLNASSSFPFSISSN